MSIKLVSFDVWSTLVRANKVYKRNRARLLAQAIKATSGPASEELVDGVLATMKRADDILDGLTIETGRQYGFNDRVRKTCSLMGAMLPDPERLYRDMSQAFLSDLPTLTEGRLPEMFATLKARGFTLAVNSNTGFVTADLMRSMLDSVGLYRHLDFALFSDEIGAAKPSPRVFTYLQEISGLRAEEILHVGDNADTDYKGALTSGLSALLYDPKEKVTTAPHVLRQLVTLPSHSILAA